MITSSFQLCCSTCCSWRRVGCGAVQLSAGQKSLPSLCQKFSARNHTPCSFKWRDRFQWNSRKKVEKLVHSHGWTDTTTSLHPRMFRAITSDWRIFSLEGNESSFTTFELYLRVRIVLQEIMPTCIELHPAHALSKLHNKLAQDATHGVCCCSRLHSKATEVNHAFFFNDVRKESTSWFSSSAGSRGHFGSSGR